jgi:hypothetical protein
MKLFVTAWNEGTSELALLNGPFECDVPPISLSLSLSLAHIPKDREKAQLNLWYR